jgi:hypothetical protein
MRILIDVFSGPLKGSEFEFNEPDVFLFGRSSNCHCCLPDDPWISRHHFMIEITQNGCTIHDLGSLNGTFVNDIKYGGREPDENPEEAAKRCKSVRIENGDTVQAGESQLKIMIDLTEKEKAPICTKCGKEIAAAQLGGNDFLKKGLCNECLEAADVEKKSKEREKKDDYDKKFCRNAYDERKQGLPYVPGYMIVLNIGQGGFGTVYFAKRLSDGKELALKTLTPIKKAVTHRDIAHFQREMTVNMALKHPNLVSFEDQGQSGELLYFAMEYCSGGSLQDLVEKRSFLTQNEALPIMRQVLDGLSYAHENGFVHRDLKPGNILFADREHKTPKISDFGMAKNFQQAGLSGFTLAGEYCGSIDFMPKEQILNYKNIKPVSDVFSIGATFYTILTGKGVYDFKSVNDPLKAILEDKIIPLSDCVTLPKNIASVIEKALNPDPEMRYQTAAEMRSALE